MSETISASLIHSPYWNKFLVFEFSENMRLTALRSTTVSRGVFEREFAFAANLLTIGNGEHNDEHARLVRAQCVGTAYVLLASTAFTFAIIV